MVVASDKGKTPSTVDKIASSLGAEVFEPEEDVSSERKDELGHGDNSHEKDAVASAINAYNHLHRELRKVDQIAEKEDISKDLAAQNYFLDKPLPSDEEEQDDETVDKVKDTDEDLDPEKQRLKKSIENLQDQNQELKHQVHSLKQDKEQLEERIDDLQEQDRFEAVKSQEVSKRDAVISERNDEIKELKQELRKTRLREKQYRKAIQHIYTDSFLELLSLDDGEVIYRSDKYNVDDLEGVMLDNYFLLLEKPEPDMEKVLKEFKHGEEDAD